MWTGRRTYLFSSRAPARSRRSSCRPRYGGAFQRSPSYRRARRSPCVLPGAASGFRRGADPSRGCSRAAAARPCPCRRSYHGTPSPRRSRRAQSLPGTDPSAAGRRCIYAQNRNRAAAPPSSGCGNSRAAHKCPAPSGQCVRRHRRALPARSACRHQIPAPMHRS